MKCAHNIRLLIAAVFISAFPAWAMDTDAAAEEATVKRHVDDVRQQSDTTTSSSRAPDPSLQSYRNENNADAQGESTAPDGTTESIDEVGDVRDPTAIPPLEQQQPVPAEELPADRVWIGALK